MSQQITKDLLVRLRPEIDAAIAAIATKHGIAMKLGGGVYEASGLTGSFKLEISVLTEGGVALTKEAAYLKSNYQLLGLKAEHLNQVFKLGNDNFTLAGFNSRSSAKPFVITKLSDGKNYIATKKQVKLALGISDYDTQQ